jgi:hypothetical protein
MKKLYLFFRPFSHTYYCSWKENDKMIWRSLRARTKAKALENLQLIKQGQSVPKQPITFVRIKPNVKYFIQQKSGFFYYRRKSLRTRDFKVAQRRVRAEQKRLKRI